MSNVLHRTTKQYVCSANTPDYPVQTWIVNPDLAPVAGVPQKYWKIIGDSVAEMSQAEKDAVDAAQAASAAFVTIGMQVLTFSDNRVGGGSDQYIGVGTITSDVVGVLFPAKAVLRHVSVRWSNTPTNFHVNVRKNGTSANVYTINTVGSTKQATVKDIVGISFSAGDYIQIYVSDVGTSINDLVVAVWFELSNN